MIGLNPHPTAWEMYLLPTDLTDKTLILGQYVAKRRLLGGLVDTDKLLRDCLAAINDFQLNDYNKTDNKTTGLWGGQPNNLKCDHLFDTKSV